jgi:hypothetical protein
MDNGSMGETSLIKHFQSIRLPVLKMTFAASTLRERMLPGATAVLAFFPKALTFACLRHFALEQGAKQTRQATSKSLTLGIFKTQFSELPKTLINHFS